MNEDSFGLKKRKGAWHFSGGSRTAAVSSGKNCVVMKTGQPQNESVLSRLFLHASITAKVSAVIPPRTANIPEHIINDKLC